MKNTKAWWLSTIIWTAVISFAVKLMTYFYPQSIDYVMNIARVIFPDVTNIDSLVSLLATGLVSLLIVIFRVTTTKQIKRGKK